MFTTELESFTMRQVSTTIDGVSGSLACLRNFLNKSGKFTLDLSFETKLILNENLRDHKSTRDKKI